MSQENSIIEGFFKTPLGVLEIKADKRGLISVLFTDKKGSLADQLGAPIKEAARQLDEYFLGKRKKFSLPLNFQGTAWQKKVLQELLKINFGQTVSYSALAEKLGGKHLARAVASACASNKMLIVIPCHRVIGVDGQLRGYVGGYKHKKWLLDFENSNN